MKLIVCLFVFLSFAIFSGAQDLSVFKKEHFTVRYLTLKYRILYPDNYDPGRPYPVLTVLHGIKERGDDNEAQLRTGGRFFARQDVRQRFPAIVIFPQCPYDSIWTDIYISKLHSMTTIRSMDFSDPANASGPARLVKLLLDSLVKAKVADPDRMYLAGLSLGGNGVYSMLQRYPRFFAAAVAICGSGDTRLANRFARTCPLWIFHGAKDRVVNVNKSRTYYLVLKGLGADVKYTEYPNVGHNSWDYAFPEPGLLPWLLSKRRR